MEYNSLPASQNNPTLNQTILFDGTCRLCQGFVEFVKKQDTGDRFHFSELQSKIAQDLIKENTATEIDLTSVLLVNRNAVLRESDAVLQIFRNLGGLWRLCYFFFVIPKSIRDAVYRFIAARRYWLGRRLYSESR